MSGVRIPPPLLEAAKGLKHQLPIVAQRNSIPLRFGDTVRNSISALVSILPTETWLTKRATEEPSDVVASDGSAFARKGICPR